MEINYIVKYPHEVSVTVESREELVALKSFVSGFQDNVPLKVAKSSGKPAKKPRKAKAKKAPQGGAVKPGNPTGEEMLQENDSREQEDEERRKANGKDPLPEDDAPIGSSPLEAKITRFLNEHQELTTTELAQDIYSKDIEVGGPEYKRIYDECNKMVKAKILTTERVAGRGLVWKFAPPK